MTLVAAISSIAVATTSYVLVARARENDARRNAVNEARFLLRLVADSRPANDEEMNALMSNFGRREDFDTVAEFEGRTYQSSVTISPATLPSAMRTPIERGRVANARVVAAGEPYLVVGAKIQPSGPRLYFFYPLSQIEQDLDALRNACAAAAMFVILMSAALGWASSGGLLLPVRRARDAARQMQEGHLDTRLPDAGKGELAELARSFNQMAETLQRSLGDLTELEARQRRFVADVSHELRTPLTALSAAVEVLEQNLGEINEPGRRAADLVITETRRLRTLTEDLMEMSRFDSGKIMMDYKRVDVGSAVASMLAARGWSDRVEVVVASSIETFADPRRLEAIIANLIGNALSHGSPPVALNASVEGPDVKIVVSDEGPGMSPADREHIFERFYKGDPARARSEGSGLGLAIARENAVAHGGSLDIEDSASGATFVLRIPLRSAGPSN